jgi:hypothetical protein
MEATSTANSGKTILLVSNEVMHYRVPVYNYFHRRFREMGIEFSVLANRIQVQNQKPLEFELCQKSFNFAAYSRIIKNYNPICVILFLHLRELITLPLMHWLKLRSIPFGTVDEGTKLRRQRQPLSQSFV